MSPEPTFYIIQSWMVVPLGNALFWMRPACIVAFIAPGNPQWHRETELELSNFLSFFDNVKRKKEIL